MLEKEDGYVASSGLGSFAMSGLLAQASAVPAATSRSTAASTTSSSSSTPPSLLSKGGSLQMDFSKLLVAELKNQDPGKPTDSDALMSQLAMMQMVTEIHALKTSMSEWASTQGLAGASNLVGRTVSVTNGQTVTSGQVSSVAVTQGSMTVQVNGQSYPVSSIQEVR